MGNFFRNNRLSYICGYDSLLPFFWMRVFTTHLPWMGMKFDVPKFDFTQSRKIPSMSQMVFLSGTYPISAFIETTSLNLHNIRAINRIVPLKSWILAVVVFTSSTYPFESTATCLFIPLILLFPSTPFSESDFYNTPSRLAFNNMVCFGVRSVEYEDEESVLFSKLCF